jgi:hypothetical protein
MIKRKGKDADKGEDIIILVAGIGILIAYLLVSLCS